jgi:hypothetical protein
MLQEREDAETMTLMISPEAYERFRQMSEWLSSMLGREVSDAEVFNKVLDLSEVVQYPDELGAG